MKKIMKKIKENLLDIYFSLTGLALLVIILTRVFISFIIFCIKDYFKKRSRNVS